MSRGGARSPREECAGRSDHCLLRGRHMECDGTVQHWPIEFVYNGDTFRLRTEDHGCACACHEQR